MNTNTVFNPKSPSMSGIELTVAAEQISAHADRYGITFEQAKAVLSW